MNKKVIKIFTRLTITIILTLGLSISFQSLLAAWQAPGSTPPNGNVNPPVYNSSPTPGTNILIDKAIGFQGNLSLTGSNANIALGSNWITGDGTDGEGIYIDGNGNIKINGSLDGPEGFYIKNNVTNVYDDTTSNSPYSRIDSDSFHTNGLGVGQIFIEGRAIDANTYIQIGGGLAGGQTTHDVILGNNNELYVKTDTGRVGIGTNNPKAKLSVNFNNNDMLNIYSPGSNSLAIQTTLDNHGIGTYGGDGENRLLLQPIIGNVGIGKTDPAYKLDVNGDVQATSFIYSSDRKLKENIKPVKNALDKILDLDGVSFDWKNDGRNDLGLIAQDVEKIFPEIVHTNENTGLKSVEYGNLVAPLVEAIKEQQEQIEKLKLEIEKLK